MTETRCIGRRVDALTIAYRVELDAARVTALEDRAIDADELGRVDFELADPDDDGRMMRFELCRTRAVNRFYLETGAVRVLVDLHGPGNDHEKKLPGWTLEVVFRATYLATHELAEALALGRSIADRFGRVHAERLRRFDLAADFENWPLARRDAELFCKHGRATLSEFHPADRATAKTYGQSTRAVTGFTVGSGGPLMLRLYNKTAELALPDREHKRELEQEQWSKQGWKGGEVTRLEFQFRGVVLDEINLRDPRELADRLDAVWAYGTRKWVRLVDPETATRLSRARLDPRWEIAQAVRFVHEHADPVFRFRLRACADEGQLIGVLLSHAAGNFELDAIANFARSLGPEKYAAENLRAKGVDPRLVVDELLTRLFGVLRDRVSGRWQRRRTDHQLARFLAQIRASHARFSSS